MTNHTLQELIQAGESENLDFKKCITNPEKIAKTIASFANTRGGIILVGVTDQGKIAGVDPEEEKYQLRLAAEQFCEPAVKLTIEELEQEDNKTVLKVVIPESGKKPHLVKGNAPNFLYYVRVHDQTVLAAHADEKKQRLALTKPKVIHYDANEKTLLQYLLKNDRITEQQFARLVNIPRQIAYQTLIRMVLAGAIHYREQSQEQYYTLAR